MKKANKNRQAILQKKRTKRNQSRKGVKYDPNKLLKKTAQTLQAGTPSTDSDNGKTVFTV